MKFLMAVVKVLETSNNTEDNTKSTTNQSLEKAFRLTF